MATVSELRAQAKAHYQSGKGDRRFKGYSRMNKGQLSSLLGQGAQQPQQPAAKSTKSTGKKFEISKTSSSVAMAISKKTGGDAKEIHESLKKKLQAAITKKRAQMKKAGREVTPKDLRAAAILAIKQSTREALHGKVASEEKSKRTGAGKADAAKAPKHGSALVARGGQIQKSAEPEPKGKKKRSANPHPKGSQAHIDAKHTITQPDAKSVEAWMQETALRASRLSPKETRELHKKVHVAALDDQQRQMGIHPDSNPFKKASAKILAIHDKESWGEAAYAHEQRDKSKPKSTKPKKERIAELHAQYDRAFDEIKKSKTAHLDELHEAVKRGDKDAIVSALNKAKIFPEIGDGHPLNFSRFSGDRSRPPTEAKEVAHKYLSDIFQKTGGDSKVLGLEPGKDFTVGELKAAYRSASLKAHPDRGGSAEGFRAVNESYERMLPKAKSPALDKVAEATGMTREEVAKAVKRRKAKQEGNRS